VVVACLPASAGGKVNYGQALFKCRRAGREFWARNWSTCVCQTEQRKGGPTIAWKIGLLAWLEGWKVGRLVGWLVIPLNMRLQIASLQTDSRVADHFGVTYWPIAR